MNVLLYPNFEKENGLLCTRRCAETLLSLGAVPMLDEGFCESVGIADCYYGPFAELLPQADVVMPIGGDGTIMRAARYAVTCDKPLLGINAGRVGFLTQMELHELDNLRLLVEGNYDIHDRMMLEVELSQGGRRRRYTGLNDIILSRGDADRIVDIHVYQGETLIAKHRADGVIFATPTGSTAYSLSAGGPIVDPTMTMLLVTAICSHSTFGRSLVLSTSSDYTVTDASAHNPKGLNVSVDGRRVGRLRAGESLTIRKSASRVRFIDLGTHNFYETVNEKLAWGR